MVTGNPVVPYVELKARSAFSFGDGAVSAEMLAERAAEYGYPAMALVDSADLGGIVRFATTAEPKGVKPIAGAELRVDSLPIALLARNEEGFRNLAHLVTRGRLENLRGSPGLTMQEVGERSKGLHLLTGPPMGEIASLVRSGGQEAARERLARWRESFGGRVAVEVQRHHVSGAEQALAQALIGLARQAGVPWVVTNEPRYLDDRGRWVHDLQTALRTGLDVGSARAEGKLLPNGEWRLKTPEEMALLWKGFEEGLEESARIAAGCDFSLRWVRPPLPRFPLPRGYDDDSFLRARVYEGAAERWGEIDEKSRRQLEHELDVIARLGFAGFFIIMWDAVRFARSSGILCQGRGSAANSAVAYCLGITAVDPVEHGLLFERFLSEARTDGLTEAPDIDVDFEMHRREEVLDYVYGQYSRAHAAITCVTQIYHAPSALQDTMRALGYPAQLTFKLSKRLHRSSPTDGADALRGGLAREQGLDLDDPRGRSILAAMRAMEDLPRMRSTHPGGFVLSREPLGNYIPIERTTMGRTILQFDKDDLDIAGVPKFDFLGLGGLSAVRNAFDAIHAYSGKKLELYNLPQNDETTFEMITRGDTVGTFQIESRAQIASVVHTKPDRLYDLVVQVALIRPGPIQARFVHPYTRRRRGLEEVSYAHPALAPILARTYGIPIFQEQAMAISMALGGYSATEADELRRTMGNQRKVARLKSALQNLRARMEARGIPSETAESISEDLLSFSNYGFPESHAWSFALIAYATSYLKAHYPAAFLLGLLNAWPMGFYAPATLVHDARRAGVEVRPPCLALGGWESTLERTRDPDAPAVRIGWSHIRGLGQAAHERLRLARTAGPFYSVEDVIQRAQLGRGEALHLARAGALEAFEPGRYAAAWEALRAAGDLLPLAPARRLPFRPQELVGHERIFLDYLATGICVDGHPIEHLRRRLSAAGIASSTELATREIGETVITAGLVIARQHPATAKGTVFLLLEDEHGYINVIVPPPLFEKNRETVRFSPFLIVEGRFEKEESVLNVVGRKFRTLDVDTLTHRSRDFR
ncbi:MAG: DNA polymerase III subunit alpha [Gemmatimonas sp.]|nr:DNA polymerase III subunit alpha [Gemmatimonas sp.]